MGLFGRLGQSTYLLSSVLMRYDHLYMCRAGAISLPIPTSTSKRLLGAELERMQGGNLETEEAQQLGRLRRKMGMASPLIFVDLVQIRSIADLVLSAEATAGKFYCMTCHSSV
jgi:hypothetical protein